MKLSDQLIQLSARIMLATKTEERLNLSSELAELAKQTISLSEPEEQATATGFLKFTKKEISKMPKTFQKILITNGAMAHIRKRPCGKYTFSYEIRYRANGYNITASSTDIETAKQKFITAITAAFQSEPTKAKQLDFETIAEEWFESRKANITELTYKNYRSYYRRYLLPSLKGRNIRLIRSGELVKIVNQVKDKGRVYEDVRSILNQIFNYANLNNLIQHNPVKLVEFIRAERKNGEALSDDEIIYFVKRLQEPIFDPYRNALLLELFFGLRPCEVFETTIDGDFLVARNAKRKKGKTEYKRIPFPAMAKEMIKSLPKDKVLVKQLNKYFHMIFPDKTQYFLRHTFASKCQEYVRREIVEVWLGDSAERLIGKTYTHFSDDFMRSEMKKVIFY